MKTFKRSILKTSAVLFCLSCLSACELAQNMYRKTMTWIEPDVDEFIFHLNTEPPTIDWTLAEDQVSFDIIQNIMEGLFELDEDLKLRNNLCDSYQVSPDGLAYQFVIRKDILWSDGEPLEAQDVVDSWLRLLDPKMKSNLSYILYDVVGARDFREGKLTDRNNIGLVVMNKYSFRVLLKAPRSYFTHLLALPATFPIRMDKVRHFGEEWTKPENIVTLGPYMIKKWRSGVSVQLKAYANYYGISPTIQKVTALIENDNTEAIALFETGQMHLLRTLPASQIERFLHKPEFKRIPILRNYFYAFNAQKKPFDNVKVRKAFAHAISRKRLVALLKGGQQQLNSWIPHELFAHNQQISLEYDPGKAQTLLSEAGYPAGYGFPVFTLVYDTNDMNRIVAEELQFQWQSVLGVKPKLENYDWKKYLDLMHQNVYSLFKDAWSADFPDPESFMGVFTSYSGSNSPKFNNAEYDQLVEKARTLATDEERKTIYDQAQKLLLEEQAAIIPLFQDSLNYLLSKKFEGLKINALESLPLKYLKLKK